MHWSQGRRMVVVFGVLLVVDLCFLPWHHFALSIDLGEVGLSNVEGVSISRTAVQSPHSYLGMGATVVTAVLAILAIAGKVGVAPGASSRGSGPLVQQLPLIVGPGVLGTLAAKLFANSDYMAPGAWIGMALAAGLAYGGVLLSQEASTEAAEGSPSQP